MKYIQQAVEPNDVAAVKQIEHKLALYCRAMDNKDDELGYSLFTKDSELDYGPIFKGDGIHFVDSAHRLHDTKEVTRHRITNILVSVYGDRAISESDGRITLVSKDEEGWHVWDAYGRYSDEWVNVKGNWLIARRTYRRSFAIVTRPEEVVLGHEK